MLSLGWGCGACTWKWCRHEQGDAVIEDNEHWKIALFYPALIGGLVAFLIDPHPLAGAGALAVVWAIRFFYRAMGSSR